MSGERDDPRATLRATLDATEAPEDLASIGGASPMATAASTKLRSSRTLPGQ